MNGFLGLGLQYPAMLLAIPLFIAGLIYAYRKRGRGTHTVVPTILILKNFQSPALTPKKFLPPLRFFVELLMLVLLALGAAGLYYKGSAQKIAVILDNSLSMKARGSSATSGDAFSAATRAIKEYLSYAHGFGSVEPQVQVFVTSPQLHAINEQPVSIAESLAGLEKIKPVYARDTIEQAIASLVEDARYDRVVAFTDRPRASSAMRPRDAALEIKTVAAQVNELTRDNISFQDISFRPGESSGEGSLQVTLTSYARSSTSVKVTLRGFAAVLSSEKAIALGEKTISLAAGASEQVVFSVKANTYNVLHAHLEVVDAASRASHNALLEDDEAWLSLALTDNEQAKIAVVSDFDAEALGLQNMRAMPVKVISSKEYENNVEVRSAFSVYVFHRLIPQELPPAAVLLVMPPPTGAASQALFNVGEEVSGSVVTRWKQSHPLLSYLNMSGLAFKKIVPLTTPVWAEQLISTDSGTVALVGERAGRRILVFGFEILPYEGKASPLLSILTLNSLKWLSNALSVSQYRQPYTQLTIAQGKGKIDRFIDGVAGYQKFEPKDEAGNFMLREPGIYVVSESGKRPEVLAVNYFENTESDTSHLSALVEPNVKTKNSASENAQNLVKQLAAIVFLVLLIDSLITLLRSKAKKAVSA